MGGKLDVAEHLDRGHAFQLGQVQIHRLREAREIGDAEDLFVIRYCRR